ncbi:hypothetical protein [Streptomyces galbus]|uniref:Uncharacterized protein n=1 Tax=Streptomyces galbus TaxID=33898 RepID=A0A4U5W5H4_STRGB|nr:hypothetical protein [Streptomyces galbus]TKS95810.1 hypothetical protein E4U92_35040 [Streptomyces galbus]GHD52442.1 hypothetical protein GCM10010335_64950 [Streptomyces galbus]
MRIELGMQRVRPPARPADPVLQAPSVDFASDVLVQCCSEWRLSRPEILRWCRGWYAKQGVDDLPAVRG